MSTPAKHIDPVSSSSASLADLLAADSVPCVLAYLQDAAIADNPDARLRALTDIVAHVNMRYSGDFNSSLATSVDSSPTLSSTESGSPLEAARWKWAEVLMRGVTDPWSRIRAICLSPMADLLLSEVYEVMSTHGASASELPLAEHPSKPRSTPQSRRLSASKSEHKSASGDAARRRRPSREACAAPPPHLAAKAASVSAPLSYVWRRWEKATHWYEHDGLVRLLVKVYGRSRTMPGAALRSDDAGLRTLLFTVLFPAFRDPQLPVRESAAALLGVLIDRDRSAPISPAITAFIADHVRDTLAQVALPQQTSSPLTATEQEGTRVLEGHLLALLVLVDMSVTQVADSSIMPLLLRLASYPASSVRQYVAQILRPPSPPVFIYLLERLCEHNGQRPHRAELDDDAQDDEENGLNWQRQETVMMALQQHLLSITSVRATLRDWNRASTCSNTVMEMMRTTTPLAVTFRAMHSPRFEIARMGLQVFPLLLQLCIRFLEAADVPHVCEMLCGANGWVQQELNALQARGDAATLAQVQLSVATVVLPALWFFLAIRRMEAAAMASRSARSSEVCGESRTELETLTRPYATLERVAFASQPHRRVSDLPNGSESSPPCPAATCALLPLTAYFAQAMDQAEWHRCVDEVLTPQWWKDLLAHPVRREQVRFGPDFVRTVQHCGTAAQVQRTVELIPTLAAALATAQTHQQCLLVAMIRITVSPGSGCASPVGERAMAFAYHDVYAAPALTEGGEAVSLGHTWLKLFVPTEEDIPTAMLWGVAEPEPPSCAPRVAIHRDSAVFRAITEVCLRDLFQSTKTERSVLRELRTLMTTLTRLSTGTSGGGGDVDWYVIALENVFGRLNKVSPRWREARADNDVDDDAAAAGEVEEAAEAAEAEEEYWDDWDDDDDDADGCAQGIYEAEALKTAAATVLTLREWVATYGCDRDRAQAAEERFRDEIKALNIRGAEHQRRASFTSY